MSLQHFQFSSWVIFGVNYPVDMIFFLFISFIFFQSDFTSKSLYSDSNFVYSDSNFVYSDSNFVYSDSNFVYSDSNFDLLGFIYSFIFEFGFSSLCDLHSYSCFITLLPSSQVDLRLTSLLMAKGC
jgi:hypothetical protein